MSFFEKLDRQELFKVCEAFAVDHDKTDRKKALVEKIENDGVTEDMYRREFDVPAQPVSQEDTTAQLEKTPVMPEPTPSTTPPVTTAPVVIENKVLLHMTRANGRFDVRGYKFTREAPYQLVSAEDATAIKRMYEGFEVATPDEVASFYDA